MISNCARWNKTTRDAINVFHCDFTLILSLHCNDVWHGRQQIDMQVDSTRHSRIFALLERYQRFPARPYDFGPTTSADIPLALATTRLTTRASAASGRADDCVTEYRPKSGCISQTRAFLNSQRLQLVRARHRDQRLRFTRNARHLQIVIQRSRANVRTASHTARRNGPPDARRQALGASPRARSSSFQRSTARRRCGITIEPPTINPIESVSKVAWRDTPSSAQRIK